MQFDNAKWRRSASLVHIYFNKYLIGLLVFSSLLISSCSKDKYEAQVPTYITIDSFSFTTDLLSEGSASANITDAWVYVNNDLVGVFELPASFPVLKEGNVELKVYAGIKDNGIAGSRARYLFYAPHIEQVTLVKGETIEISPSVTYESGLNFAWMENFENASLSFLYTAGSDTIINKQSTTVKEGNFSGQIYLESSMDFFEATSIAYSNLPQNGGPVYLEMDFKTNQPLLIGVYVDANQYNVVTLNIASDWKKIYINLTDIVNEVQNVGAHKVFLGIKETSSNPFLTNNPEIYIDNIKLIHY
jgi:hypothetical protein